MYSILLKKQFSSHEIRGFNSIDNLRHYAKDVLKIDIPAYWKGSKFPVSEKETIELKAI